MASLDEDKNPFEALLDYTWPTNHRRAVLEFVKSPHKLRVGADKIEFPYSPAHLMRTCKFWQLATEAGDTPTEILTEHHIGPNNKRFQQSWLVANGLLDLTPDILQNNLYLDYLLFHKKDRPSVNGFSDEINMLREKARLRFKLIEEKQEEERLKIEADRQRVAESTAARIMSEFLQQSEKRMEIPNMLCQRTRCILRESGFTVTPFPITESDGRKCLYVYLAPKKRKAEAEPAKPAKKQKK